MRALAPADLAVKIGMIPDDWQDQVLRSSSSRMLLNCSRQSGKSTVASVLAVWKAIYEPGSLVLLLSPSLRQSQELFRKCLVLYRSNGRPVPSEAENQLSLELENGSRIVSLPGQESTVRGFSSVSLLIVDEAARVPDDSYFAVRPMLAVSGGRLVGMSTPAGKRGWWYEAWVGSEEWERYEIPATKCPRFSPSFLRDERETIGEWWFRQEYLCEFVETVDQIFSYDYVMAAVSSEVKPLFE